MKAQFLKIAKCKDEKSFYKKYPTQEAFFKAHPEARSIKKAQIGAYIGGDGSTSNAKPLNYQTYYDDVDKLITGSTEKERQEAEADKAKAAADSKGGGGGFDLSSIMDMMGSKGEGDSGEGAEGMMSMLGGGRNGKHIPRAQVGESIYDPSTQSGLPTYNPMADPSYSIGQNQQIVGQSTAPQGGAAPAGGGFMDKAISGIPVLGSIFGGIKALGAEKEAAKAAKQQKTVSGLQLTASATRPEQTQRRYVRPEDVIIQPNQMFPTYGVGTNVLARDGVRLQSGGEIQNTYAPNYLYDDLGYEPLNDSNVKQYYHGGGIPKAQGGFSNYASTLGGGGSGFSGAGASGSTPWGAIGGIGSGMANSAAGGGNAGGQIGGGIGEGVGAIFGPAGMAIGKTLGTAVGNAVDPYAKAIETDTATTKRNIENTAYNNMAPGFIAPYQAYARDGSSIPNYEDGGYINPEYNPQVITMFGDHTAADFADYANKYRAGGHLKSYTPPSDRAMETYAMGGQLQTHWGGEAETMSYNPYSAGSGEMVKFNGQSHNESDRKGNTGIGITYGESPVEVERGEPMFEMQGGGEVNPQTGEPENTGVVFGNMSIDKKVASQLNDPELMKVVNIYDKVKFKNAGLNLAKQEVKQNKIIDKNSKLIDSFKVETSLDKAKLAGLQANLEGANAKLKNIANTKIILANYQNAINDSKDELSDAIGQNLSAEDLAKGYVKLDKDPVTMNAKWGGSIRKAAEGTTIDPGKITKAQLAAYIAKGYVKNPKNPNIYYLPGTSKEVVTKLAGSEAEIKKGSGPIKDNYKGPKMSNAEWTAFLKTKKGEAYKQKYITGTPDEVIKAAVLPSEKKEMMTTPGDEVIVEDPAIAEGKSKFPWQMYANQALQYLRPTDQEGLDMSQLYPEMYALGSNQLEPVPVQGYRPDLATPYDISYQDILNANQADYNASQRMVGYNPAAQSVLNAQKYAANEKVLGEQFRANQAMQSGVYDQNRQTLNDAKLKNLGIFDRQYERQAEAKSNTKATTQAALNSIADKYAKNKLENKTLGVYENLYNYRFDKDGRAINMNGLAQFNIDGTDASDKTSAPEGYEYETILKKKKKDVAKNGSILRSFKNL
jgi:hypothetical protein